MGKEVVQSSKGRGTVEGRPGAWPLLLAPEPTRAVPLVRAGKTRCPGVVPRRLSAACSPDRPSHAAPPRTEMRASVSGSARPNLAFCILVLSTCVG